MSVFSSIVICKSMNDISSPLLVDFVSSEESVEEGFQDEQLIYGKQWHLCKSALCRSELDFESWTDIRFFEHLMTLTNVSPQGSHTLFRKHCVTGVVCVTIMIATLDVLFTLQLELTDAERIGCLGGSFALLSMLALWFILIRTMLTPCLRGLYNMIGCPSSSHLGRHKFIRNIALVTWLLIFITIFATFCNALSPNENLFFFGTHRSLSGWSFQHFIGYSFFVIWHIVNILHAAATLAFVATTLSLTIAISNVTRILSGAHDDEVELADTSSEKEKVQSNLVAERKEEQSEVEPDIDHKQKWCHKTSQLKPQVNTLVDCLNLYKALLRHVTFVSSLLSNWFVLHGVFTAVAVAFSFYVIETIKLPGPEFVDISTSIFFLWTLSLPFASCASVSSLGLKLQKVVDISTHDHESHPLHDINDKAVFMAFIARNPVGFVFHSCFGRTRIDHSLIRFTSAGTIIYIIYYLARIMNM